MKFISNQSISLSQQEKDLIIYNATQKYKEFMEALLIDVDNDPNSKDTPERVTKMFVNELCKGRYNDNPFIESFPNTEQYNQIIFTNCEVISLCAHHHVPIISKVFMGILTNPSPKSKLIGLSKYTRIVEWIAARPTIQEEMTKQIHDAIYKICENNFGVMIYIIGQHGCTTYRGIKQSNSKMITSAISGAFKESETARIEFMNMVTNTLGENK